MHSHDRPHISFILNGGHIEKREKSEQELFPGNMLFYYSEEAHLYRPKRFPASSINLEIEDSFFKRYEISEAQLEKAIRENVDTVFRMLQVLKELVYDDPVSQPAIHCLLLQLLNNTLSPVRKTTPGWAIELKHLLNDQWEKNFSLFKRFLASTCLHRKRKSGGYAMSDTHRRWRSGSVHTIRGILLTRTKSFLIHN